MPNSRKKIDDFCRLRSTKRPIYDSLLAIAVSSCDHPDKDLLLGALRARQYSTLLRWSDRGSPQSYGTASQYYDDCQLSALIRKYPFTKDEIPGLNPRDAAVKKFHSAEHRCKWQNRKERALRRNFDPYFQIREYARSYIQKVIGVKPDLTAILDKCDFTAGASLGVHGNATNIQRKIFAESWSVTPSALPLARLALWKNVHVRDCILPGAIKCYDYAAFCDIVNARSELVSYNKISFVPKTAKTHRGMAVEPTLNGYLQKGIDGELRKLLKAAGLNLSDQTTNQVLAHMGTLGGFNPYATIDLSSASDSLSTELVKDLLPAEWYELLDQVRAPLFMLDGQLKRYEKFCSMGNGFCFPLQTLVFASVCHAVSRVTEDCKKEWYNFSVYGDDIILPQNRALLAIEVLREFGFKTNNDKTFIVGPFRESCGADWFQGQDVRPVHLEDRLIDIRQLFSLHNSTLRSRRCEEFFTEFRHFLRSTKGSDFLRPGREPGDTCYSVPLDQSMTSRNVFWDKKNQVWRWKEIISSSVPDPGRLGEQERANVLLLAVMRGANSAEPFTLRYETKPKVKMVSRPWKDEYHGDLSDVIKECREAYNGHVGDVRKAVARYLKRAHFFASGFGTNK